MATGTFIWTNRRATLFREKIRSSILSAPIAEGYESVIKLGRMVPQFGKNSGENWLVTRRDKLRGTMYRHAEDEDIQEGSYSDNETHGYIYEYARQIPFTRRLEELSQRNVVQEIRDVLAEDIQLTEASTKLYQLLADTHYFMEPTGLDTSEFVVGTPANFTIAVPVNFNLNHLDHLVTRANYLQIPKVNGRRFLFGRVGAFDVIWRAARELMKYTDSKSVITGREVPVIRGVEFHEISFDTPNDLQKNGAAFLTPITSRTAYTANTNQNWFGNYSLGAVNFNEMLLVGGEDCIEHAVVRPITVALKASDDFDRLKTIGWHGVWGDKQPWDENHFVADGHTDAIAPVTKGRVRTILVTTEAAVTY